MPISGFLAGRHARILSAVLIVQAALLYAVSRREKSIDVRPLATFPAEVGHWRLGQEGVVEREVMDVLRADDVLSRTYVDAGANHVASLFVAFFRSQRTGQAPHSPKNCLPGSGWVPSQASIVPLSVPGADGPIRVNLYVVAKGDQRSVVIYWYQSRGRVVASEYTAKFYTVADAILYNRTDTTLVRIAVPVTGGDASAAVATAEDFVRAIFPSLRRQLPS